ncbi:MAG TPA: hypothetical protein VHS56_04545 [Candidatus Cybelea sp.]|jgi:uncharacterized protein YdbL (DUF1318 family)|nr:hypothetical protein [Candidatus Cybelea sp.]
MRNRRDGRSGGSISELVGTPADAQRFTVNIAAEVAAELRSIAAKHRVSESSVVEISLRQLFRRIAPATMGGFLHDHGACLRRR